MERPLKEHGRSIRRIFANTNHHNSTPKTKKLPYTACMICTVTGVEGSDQSDGRGARDGLRARRGDLIGRTGKERIEKKMDLKDKGKRGRGPICKDPAISVTCGKEKWGEP